MKKVQRRKSNGRTPDTKNQKQASPKDVKKVKANLDKEQVTEIRLVNDKNKSKTSQIKELKKVTCKKYSGKMTENKLE